MSQSILRSSLSGDRALSGRFAGLAPSSRARAAPATSVLLLRSGLVLGCAFAIGIAAWLGDPSGYLQADPALARLLRGMAIIKGMIALAAVGAVFWRLGWPVSKAGAGAYLGCAWVLSGSTMIIWQLSFIVPAALLFHAAALSLLLVSFRDRSAAAD
jgi:hypothetical protein